MGAGRLENAVRLRQAALTGHLMIDRLLRSTQEHYGDVLNIRSQQQGFLAEGRDLDLCNPATSTP